MQVLETIQEYTPIKHGWNYLSSWIGKGHTYRDTRESELSVESRLENQNASVAGADANLEETSYGTPTIAGLDKSIDKSLGTTPKSRNQSSSSSINHGQDRRCERSDQTEDFADKTSGNLEDEPNLSSTPAHSLDVKRDPRTPDIRINDICYADVGSRPSNHVGHETRTGQDTASTKGASLSQTARLPMDSTCMNGDDPLTSLGNLSDTDTSIASSSRTLPRENGVAYFKGSKGKARDLDATRRFPTLLKTWQKRQLKARRHKANGNFEGRLVFRRYRLPDSVSEVEPLRRGERSKSESDINVAVASNKVGEGSGDSDQSVQSLNVVHDNTEDDYIDIDFYRKGSFSGSSCKDTSVSSGSLDLSSDWTEFTLSLSEHSIGEECRESDQLDTESCRSQDLSLNLHSHRTKRKRWRKRFLHGQAVNEFVDKECFCCHCVIL